MYLIERRKKRGKNDDAMMSDRDVVVIKGQARDIIRIMLLYYITRGNNPQ